MKREREMVHPHKQLVLSQSALSRRENCAVLIELESLSCALETISYCKTKKKYFLPLSAKTGSFSFDNSPTNCDQGPVSRKPRKLFWPVKTFLVHLYLRMEKCVRLNFFL